MTAGNPSTVSDFVKLYNDRAAKAGLADNAVETQAAASYSTWQVLEAAIKIDGCPAQARLMLAELLLATGDREGARRVLTPILQRGTPDLPEMKAAIEMLQRLSGRLRDSNARLLEAPGGPGHAEGAIWDVPQHGGRTTDAD